MESQGNRLKINFSNELDAGWSALSVAIGLFLILAWYGFKDYAIIGAFVSFCFHPLPAAYLHWQYSRKNKGEEYEIRHNRIIRYKDGKKEELMAEDIAFINLYLAPSLYKGSNFHILGIESYYFACVHMKGGRKLFLTCLLSPRLRHLLKQLHGVQIRRKKSLFNSLRCN